jgi:hypothetical protein
MKHPLLLLLLLPLSSYAQSGPRNYVQQNQQSRDYFNRSMNQRTQEFQQQQLQGQMNRRRAGQGGQLLTAETQLEAEAKLLQAQAKQQQAEQEATQKFTLLAQEQQRQRQEHPAQNPQLAAAQQKADDKQLNLLAVKNYREVFLTGQVSTAQQAQKLSPKNQRIMRNLTDNLLNDAWWSKQAGASLAEKVKAYSDTLTSLTTGLLGFELASPPPAPAQFTASHFDELLAKGAFDQNVARQLIQDVALTEKLLASEGLAKAVVDFKNLNSNEAASREIQSNPKKLQKAVTTNMRHINLAMLRYNAQIEDSGKMYYAQNTMLKATATYLAKNNK